MLQDILLIVVGLVLGAVIGFLLAKAYMKKMQNVHDGNSYICQMLLLKIQGKSVHQSDLEHLHHECNTDFVCHCKMYLGKELELTEKEYVEIVKKYH